MPYAHTLHVFYEGAQGKLMVIVTVHTDRKTMLHEYLLQDINSFLTGGGPHDSYF